MYKIVSYSKKIISVILIILIDYLLIIYGSKANWHNELFEVSRQVEVQSSNIRYVIAKSGLNMRKEANKNSEIVVSIPFGSEIILDRAEGDWAYVTYNDNSGWCYRLYITDENPN